MHSAASEGPSAVGLGPMPGRREIRLALAIGGVLNAILYQVRDAVGSAGALGAVFNTFGISAIVWIALALAVRYLAREPEQSMRRREAAVDVVVVVLLLLPLKHFAWIGLSLLALNILCHSVRGSEAGRGGLLLLAVTVPMFWGKVFLSLFSGIILTVDAMLVSAVLGLPRLGNTLALADGRTHLWIEGSCSSMLNLSLVMLCWTMFCAVRGLHLRRTWRWAALCGGLVVALNIVRLSLIAALPEHYDQLHGGIGATVTSWLLVAVMVCVFEFGMSRSGHVR